MNAPTLLDQSLDWIKHVGLVLLLHHVVTAIVTAAFRPRTPEEEAAMQAKHPWAFKAWQGAKATGLDSPAFWKWVVSLFFARALKPAEQAAQDAGVPPEPPTLPGA